jgi:hypothetical protein
VTYSSTVRYDKPLVRHALNRFMARRLGLSFFVAVVGVAAILLFAFLLGEWNWILSVMGFVLLAFLAFLVFAYFARLRAAEGFFDKANEPTVTFRFTENGIETISDLGTSDLKWHVFDEILKFSDVWLLVYAKSGYMTLPVDQISPECLEFIDAQVSKGNAPVR